MSEGSPAHGSSTRGPQLRTLEIADSPGSWRAGGFTVDAEGVCVLGSTAIRLTSGNGGFRSWSFDGIGVHVSEIDGLTVDGSAETAVATSDAATDGTPQAIDGPTPSQQPNLDLHPSPHPNSQPHPNGIASIDHIVIRSGNCERTIAALEAAGFPRRGGRTTTSGGFPAAQSFFWAGDVILELIGPDVGEPVTDQATSIFGLALVAPDLESTARSLGELLGKPKPAVQTGRKIAGFRTRAVGMSLPIAVMSPHPTA